MPLGKEAKIVAGRQRRNMGNNHFRQVEQVHNLSHAGTGKPHLSGYFGHGERFVPGQDGLPFQSHPDRIQDARFGCRFMIWAGFHLMAGGFRIPEWMDDKWLCTPPGKGDAHEDMDEFKVRIG